jgi:hypothetical protein
MVGICRLNHRFINDEKGVIMVEVGARRVAPCVRRVRLMATMLSVALAAGAVISVAEAHASVNGAPTSPQLVATVPHTLLSERDLAGGDKAASWSVPGGRVAIAGPPNLTADLSAPAGGSATNSGTLSVGPSAIDKATAGNMVAAYAASGRSVVSEAEGVGATPAQAQGLAQSLGVSSSPDVVTPDTSNGGILDSWCGLKYFDNSDGWEYSCIVQELVYQEGYSWWIGDKISTTAYDSAHALTLAESYDEYLYNTSESNQMVEWSPTGPVSVGACTSYTAGFSAFNLSLAATANICPNGIAPIFVQQGSYYIGFGSYWTGSTAEGTGLTSVDLDYDPPLASPTALLVLGWNWS